MGNNSSQIRRSSITYNESNVRKSSTSQQPKANHNLDEEFSDMILHEVKKDSDEIRDKNLFGARNQDGKGDGNMTYNKFSNDLIEDEYNELNDLIDTDETELSRNIIPDKDRRDPNEDAMDFDPKSTGDDMDVDSNDTNTPGDDDENAISRTPDTPTPDLSTVDFTKIVSDSLKPKTQPIQQLGTLPNRGPVNVQQQAPPAGHLSQESKDSNKLVPVEIKWVNITGESIQKVSIIGSFSNWRHIIRLKPSPVHPHEYVVTIKLPLGVHKLLYIINNEYRVSEQLPTATDQEGIFFNWFEVLDEQHLFNHSQNQPCRTNASTKYDANIIQAAGQFEINEIKKKSNSFLARITKDEPNVEHVEYMNQSGDDLQKQMHQELLLQQQMAQDYGRAQQGYDAPQAQFHPVSETPPTQERYISLQDNNSSSFLLNEQMKKKIDYSNEIPEIFINYNYFKSQNADFELPEPPQLPAHLNNVLLNKISNQASNSNISQPHPHHLHHPPQNPDGFRPPSASFMGEQGPYSGSDASHAGAGTSKRPPLRRADSSYYASNQEAYHLSVPNHVILNHLMTTSIRNDVLTVACITRYSGKFVTQIMHSPADTS